MIGAYTRIVLVKFGEKVLRIQPKCSLLLVMVPKVWEVFFKLVLIVLVSSYVKFPSVKE